MRDLEVEGMLVLLFFRAESRVCSVCRQVAGNKGSLLARTRGIHENIGKLRENLSKNNTNGMNFLRDVFLLLLFFFFIAINKPSIVLV